MSVITRGCVTIFYLNKKTECFTNYTVEMKDEEKYFKVSVSVDDLQAALINIINSTHKKLIAEVLMTNLKNTPKGYSHLYMALSGVRETSPYKIGDNVLLKMDYLPGWRIEKKRFVEGEDLHQGKVKAIVTDVDLTKEDSIKVEFMAYTSPDPNEGKKLMDEWMKKEYMTKSDFDFPIE